MTRMTKRAMQRVVVALVMVATLMMTTSLMAEQETVGGEEDMSGYCQNVAVQCGSTCLSSWYACRNMGQNADLCQDQYDWCIDDCMVSDFWCGFRQY